MSCDFFCFCIWWKINGHRVTTSQWWFSPFLILFLFIKFSDLLNSVLLGVKCNILLWNFFALVFNRKYESYLCSLFCFLCIWWKKSGQQVTPFQLYFLPREVARSVFVPSKVVFTFTITPFLSLENFCLFSESLHNIFHQGHFHYSSTMITTRK